MVVDADSIKKRIKQIAQSIAAFYGDSPYTALVIIKGSFQIWSDIQNELNEIYRSGKYDNKTLAEYLTVKSYLNQESTKKVNILGEEFMDLEGKDVLIVEDMIDSGRTMKALIEKLSELKVKRVRICSFVCLEGKLNFPFKVDHVGFILPNKFIVGYGIDYNQCFRDLDFIGHMSDKGIEKFKIVAKK